MLFGTPCFRECGLVSIARPATQPDLPRRAGHSRDKVITANYSTMFFFFEDVRRESHGDAVA